MEIIAKIYTSFKEKFGIPRQAGLSSSKATVVFEKPYRCDDALRGLAGYSHIWLLWKFSDIKRTSWSATVRPPRLGGNTKMGVFATRSPYRPNPIGLSSVKLVEIKKTEEFGTVLIVEGADMLDGTPIYDIKPYLAYTDSHPDAISGFADEVRGYELNVIIPDDIKCLLTEDETREIKELLSGDPRPSYKDDGDMEYGMSYGHYNISFKVSDKLATVTRIEKLKN